MPKPIAHERFIAAYGLLGLAIERTYTLAKLLERYFKQSDPISLVPGDQSLGSAIQSTDMW